jgi:site-specific recombinase XerD
MNPVDVYLARLGSGSRRGMNEALGTIATFLSGGTVGPNETDWASIRYHDTFAVRGWLVNKYAPNTAKRMLAALRGVLKECWRLGMIPYEEFAKASDIAPVHGESEPSGRALGDEELGKLFDACHTDATPAGIRDGAILGLLYGLGLRRAELVALDFNDYNREQGIVAVHGKGNKPRLGYAMERVKTLLDAWLQIRGDWGGPMFCPINKGGVISQGRFTPQGLALVVKKRATGANVETFSCHDLRRSFITHLLSSGADISTVQRLAGHRQVTTTVLYDRRGEDAKVQAAKLLAIPNRR